MCEGDRKNSGDPELNNSTTVEQANKIPDGLEPFKTTLPFLQKTPVRDPGAMTPEGPFV